MKLEIVSHCWHYSRPLIFQLSSLILFPPRTASVTVTVFYSETDENTAEVLQFFSSLEAPPTVAVRPWPLAPNIVTRRMIGRNLAALRTEADWIWFTDCDYVFRDGCFDSLSQWTADPSQPLFFPRIVHLNRSHAEGDEELQRVAAGVQVTDIGPERYVPHRCRRAIGGMQIVRGELARRLGYCCDSHLQCVPADTWAPNREDIWFRRALGTKGAAAEVRNVYRIRHSSRGGALLDGTRLRDACQSGKVQSSY